MVFRLTKENSFVYFLFAAFSSSPFQLQTCTTLNSPEALSFVSSTAFIVIAVLIQAAPLGATVLHCCTDWVAHLSLN